MEDIKQQWADFICEFLKTTNLTQRELAERCGVNESTVSRWKDGRQLPHGSARRLLEEFAYEWNNRKVE